MLIGAHMPNSLISQADIQMFRLGGFQSAKLMWYADPDDVLRLANAEAEHFMVRLPDSTLPTGRIPSYQDYAKECAQTIKEFCDVGVFNFQMDNEPNLQSWGAEREWDYQWFIGQALAQLRKQVPSVARIGLAPLAWTALDTAHQQRWLKALAGIAKQFSFITCNSYWQQSGPTGTMLWPQFGANAQTFHEWMPDKPIVVGEWGNSLCQAAHPPAPAVIQAAMAAQYPQWLAWAAAQGYIEASYVYLIGGTDDWKGFRLTEQVAIAVRGVTLPTGKAA